MRKSPLALDLPLFEQNLQKIRDRVAELSPTQGDSPQILPVTKYLSPQDTHRLLDAGYAPVGENRAAELEQKSEPGQDPASWHFIGRLQRNKIRRVIPRISLFHALDSEKLAATLDAWVDDHLKSPLSVLVQINIAAEDQKAGLDVIDAEATVISWMERFPSLRFEGLMTMAPNWPAEQCRPVFGKLRQLRSSIQNHLSTEDSQRFRHLSMGMSGDWEVAVEEGSTLLRIGTALYLAPEEKT